MTFDLDLQYQYWYGLYIEIVLIYDIDLWFLKLTNLNINIRPTTRRFFFPHFSVQGYFDYPRFGLIFLTTCFNILFQSLHGHAVLEQTIAKQIQMSSRYYHINFLTKI